LQLGLGVLQVLNLGNTFDLILNNIIGIIGIIIIF